MIRVQPDDFDVGRELAELTAGRRGVGGVCSFVGLVRDLGPAEDLQALILEHYPGMTERQLAAIAAEAERRWDLQGSVIIHRYGRLLPGDRIVLVAAAAAHRETAFEACRFLIDWLKTKAPFWKQEETPSGCRWVQPRPADATAQRRWLTAGIDPTGSRS